MGNILRRHNITPAPERSRSTTWKEFIRSHLDVLAGADFFTVEVLTWRGLVTYFYEKVVKVKADVAAILNFFLRLRSRSRPTIGTRLVPIGGMRKGGQRSALKPLLRGAPRHRWVPALLAGT